MSARSETWPRSPRPNEPLTLIQPRDDAAHHALLKRFWRPVGVLTTCTVCGEEFWAPRSSTPRKYCSHDCHLRHRRNLDGQRRTAA